MGRTLHVLVTCCLEDTRTEILSEVMKSLHSSCEYPYNDTIVFDNASLQYLWEQLAASDVLNKFPYIFRAKENYGYWSAVNWALNNHQSILGKRYEFVYVIESDMIHVSYDKLNIAENFLVDSTDIASVRLQEFVVAEKHLYDKLSPQRESRRYAWTRLSNHFTGKPAHFAADAKYTTVYRTNLAPQVPALNRMSFMREAFEILEKKEKISEVDFQEVYFKKYSETAVLDGGIYNCSKNTEDVVLTGSYTDTQKLHEIGYRTTRVDQITALAGMEVLQCHAAP